MSKTKDGSANRIDVVFIRKSSPGQDDEGQAGNVEKMLKARGVYVAADRWFTGTVSRRKVRGNADFARLMGMVEADRVGTVYVESQDRWGTADRVELFELLGTLRKHSTRLFDLRAGKDLTEKDFATEMLAILNSFKSEKELQDLSYRSLRSRVHNVTERCSWPSGLTPYGYGKACYSDDGTLRWQWHPANGTVAKGDSGRKFRDDHGQLFYPGTDTPLTPGPAGVKLPRREAKSDVVKLVVSNDPARVRAVRLIFELYTQLSISRRQIATRLNAEGLVINGKPFAHVDITSILANPAYAGDTRFGRTQTGVFNTFSPDGVVEVRSESGRKYRDNCIIRRDTHEPLVDRTTWESAQKKLASERERKSFPPRNPDYFLKTLFVCGHCGKGVVGRTERNRVTGEKIVMYVCGTYNAARASGYSCQCGYQRITHQDAEKLLLDKIAELNLPFEQTASEQARANLQERLARLGHEEEEFIRQWEQRLCEGVDALSAYLIEEHPEAGEWPSIRKLRKVATDFYLGCLDEKPDEYRPSAKLPLDLAELRRGVQEAEKAAVASASAKLDRLRDEHKRLTLAWAKASDLQQRVLKEEIERLESEIREWEPRTLPLTQRLNTLFAAEAERDIERQKLLAEWPTLEDREKGEALRRLFKKVKLFWEKTFHPAAKKPRQPRKQRADGRYSYALQEDKVEWLLSTCELDSQSSKTSSGQPP